MWKLTVALCLIWAVTLLYGEMVAFWVPSLWSCSWPHLISRSSNSSTVGSTDYLKIAVIADPQLMDKTSLPLAPKSLALEAAQFYTDLYMRRAFLASIQPFRPDVILFLGDYFDGGPYLSDEDLSEQDAIDTLDVRWQESYSRFKHTFALNAQGKYADIPVYYIPGNHDIGYAGVHSHRPEVVRRYENGFGTRNYQFRVGNVDFIAVDAQSLDGIRGHPRENLASPPWDFVKNVSSDIQLHPRVLLTHIPLYRQDWTECGPHRKSPTINQRIVRAGRDQEIMYQNYITEESSNYLIDSVKPVLVLSGHDHDQCTVTHKSKSGSLVEHTLGTISWQQGNLYPSFMLLSVSNAVLTNTSSPEEAVLTQLCFLPLQTHIYIWYLSQFVLTLLVLLFWPTNGVDFLRRLGELAANSRQLMSFNIFDSGRKEKDEDENCEYEMIWDAEGSMHLVKKASTTSSTRSSEKNSVESKGNAVMRSSAKRPSTQEMEVSMNINADLATDPMLKLMSRTSKSRTKIVIQRLVRTFRMLTIIAVVNVPLYMMLLFKDWIDQ